MEDYELDISVTGKLRADWQATCLLFGLLAGCRCWISILVIGRLWELVASYDDWQLTGWLFWYLAGCGGCLFTSVDRRCGLIIAIIGRLRADSFNDGQTMSL